MRISHATDSDYELFSEQRDPFYRNQGLMVIDSGRLVLRALKLPRVRITKIMCPEPYYLKHKDLITGSGAEVIFADEAKTRSITGFRIHQGVMAIAKRPSDGQLTDFGSTVVVLNGVNNAENVGAIVRNCLAFGATDLLVGPTSCSPFIRRSIRVSMGSIFKCRVRHSSNLVEDLSTLKSQSYQVIASQISSDSVPIDSISFGPKSCLIIGCEGTGIEPQIAGLADHSAHIPINSEVDSLNASVATGIALYHLSRRRLDFNV